MGNMRNWILGAAVVAGVAAFGAPTAQAAEFGFRVRGPVAYVPPCPGPGYIWTAGYMANGIALFSGAADTQSAMTADSTVAARRTLIATGILTVDMNVFAGNPLCPITCSIRPLPTWRGRSFCWICTACPH